MKERILDFNAVVKESLMNKFPLKEIALSEDLKFFNSKRLLGLVRAENHTFTSDGKIEKLACSNININKIASVSLGFVHPGNESDLPILIFEKMELNRIITFSSIDFIPLSKRADYQEQYIEPLKLINDDLDFLPGKINSASTRFNSPYNFHGYFKRYHKFTVGVALERYLEMWTSLIGKEPLAFSPEYREEIKSNKEKFRKEFLSANRSIKVLRFIFGKTSAERILKELLF